MTQRLEAGPGSRPGYALPRHDGASLRGNGLRDLADIDIKPVNAFAVIGTTGIGRAKRMGAITEPGGLKIRQ